MTKVAVLLIAVLSGLPFGSASFAAGPFGSIRVGNWNGGAYTDDKTGAFSHCAAGTSYANGVNVIVGQNVNGSWLLGFANPAFRLTQGGRPVTCPTNSRSAPPFTTVRATAW